MKRTSLVSIIGALALMEFSPAAMSSAETQPLFEQPILLTSAGQSADVQLASVLFRKAGLAFALSKLAEDKDLEGQKTLALVLGASLKGLGAAGLDMDKEKARIAALLKGAEKRGIAVLCLHLGGADRRGEVTDALIRAYLPAAKMALVVRSGNKDGIFTNICQDKGIPLTEVEKTINAGGALKRMFKPTA